MTTKKTKQKNPNWGGARSNAGRKKKYGETTKVMTFRVPISKLEAVKEAIRYILNKNLEDNY
jgi:hypothetical protein